VKGDKVQGNLVPDWNGLERKGGSWFWPDWNNFKWQKLILARLKWLGMKEAGFGLTEIDWNR
jgi:hypothetical protein